MYEIISTAQHGTVPHRTAGDGRARPQRTAPHGTAERCSAKLALRCAAELSRAQPGPGMMILRKQNRNKRSQVSTCITRRLIQL